MKELILVSLSIRTGEVQWENRDLYNYQYDVQEHKYTKVRYQYEYEKYKKEKYWGKDDPVQENDDCIIINGVKIQKPFVEKPVYSEDHNIYVYYPRSIGGGSKRLAIETENSAVFA